MIIESKYPILEFDDNKIAKINPDSFAGQPFKTDKLIITFFPEVMNKLEDKGKPAIPASRQYILGIPFKWLQRRRETTFLWSVSLISVYIIIPCL